MRTYQFPEQEYNRLLHQKTPGLADTVSWDDSQPAKNLPPPGPRIPWKAKKISEMSKAQMEMILRNIVDTYDRLDIKRLEEIISKIPR